MGRSLDEMGVEKIDGYGRTVNKPPTGTDGNEYGGTNNNDINIDAITGLALIAIGIIIAGVVLALAVCGK